MTKEEAIKKLRDLRASDERILIQIPRSEAMKNEIKALDMAIKALEQPTSDDCVSRQAVKTAIYSHCYGTEHGLYFEGNVEHIINELPPATPTHCIAAVKFSKDDLREICNERIEIACKHGTCKDCKHREGIDLNSCFCAKHGNSARDDFYCADFEEYDK